MGSQSPSLQRRIAEAAIKDGSFGELLWFAEIETTKSLGATSRYVPACHPWQYIPCVATGREWEATRHDADLLCEILRSAAMEVEPERWRGVTFWPAITTRFLLTEMGLQWYLWGIDGPLLDRVCPRCGSIAQVHPGGWADCDCDSLTRGRWPQIQGLVESLKSFVWVERGGGWDGVMVESIR